MRRVLWLRAVQLEHEAYFPSGHRKGKGHGGFQAQRQFGISGQVPSMWSPRSDSDSVCLKGGGATSKSGGKPKQGVAYFGLHGNTSRQAHDDEFSVVSSVAHVAHAEAALQAALGPNAPVIKEALAALGGMEG